MKEFITELNISIYANDELDALRELKSIIYKIINNTNNNISRIAIIDKLRVL